MLTHAQLAENAASLKNGGVPIHYLHDLYPPAVWEDLSAAELIDAQAIVDRFARAVRERGARAVSVRAAYAFGRAVSVRAAYAFGDWPPVR